jgi:hypothetical protein
MACAFSAKPPRAAAASHRQTDSLVDWTYDIASIRVDAEQIHKTPRKEDDKGSREEKASKL